MQTSLFDYALPPERIAQHPPAERDAARLLVLDRAARIWDDRRIRELPELLHPGDLLVFNDTRVIPARLRALRDSSGGKVEILLLPPECGGGEVLSAAATSAGQVVRRALTRSGGHLRVGETFSLAGGVKARLVERQGEAGDVIAFDLAPSAFEGWLQAHGEVPLPPYIHRAPGPSAPEDRERYQTLLAQQPGAVAAPTAGLHFSSELLAALDARGVRRTALTLHVGPGTFKPVKAERIEEHHVDPEPYMIGADAARAVTSAKSEGRRVVAVGTTVLRTLESCWDAQKGELRAGAGMTGLFVRPPFTFQVAGALLTNFHLPRSSLLMLAAAFAAPGREDGIAWVKAAYAHAIEKECRFFSYGDACLFS